MAHDHLRLLGAADDQVHAFTLEFRAMLVGSEILAHAEFRLQQRNHVLVGEPFHVRVKATDQRIDPRLAHGLVRSKLLRPAAESAAGLKKRNVSPQVDAIDAGVAELEMITVERLQLERHALEDRIRAVDCRLSTVDERPAGPLRATPQAARGVASLLADSEDFVRIASRGDPAGSEPLTVDS